MFGNIGTALLRPGAALHGGSSSWMTGTNPGVSSSPAGFLGLKPPVGGGAPNMSPVMPTPPAFSSNSQMHPQLQQFLQSPHFQQLMQHPGFTHFLTMIRGGNQ